MAELATIFSDLVRLETELWGTIDARLRAEFDLPLSRFEPMQVIARHGSCRVLDVANELAIGVSGTSKLIDRLAGDGLCRRRPNPADRRSSIVTLTREGEWLLAAAEPVFAAELEHRMGRFLPARERDAFAAALRRLRGGRSLRALPSPD